MNFKQLDDLIHGGAKEIFLDSDIVLDDGEELEYPKGIELDVDDLVIDGEGHEIDACSKSRIFYCTAKNISLKNLTLKNGKTATDGGAIHNDGGELTVTGSTIMQNSAKSGGAIYSRGELTVSGCTFTGNVAKDGSGGSIRGSDNLTIAKSAFKDNTARLGGGAIYFFGDLTIAESVFKANTARYDGGAIMYSSELYSKKSYSGELNIKKSIFEANTTRGEGGAINNVGKTYNSRAKLTIEESSFSSNTAEGGGAIYNSIGELIVNESSFTKNIAPDGGAIKHDGGNSRIFKCELSANKSKGNIISNRDYLQIRETDFKDNFSQYSILNEGDEGNLDIVKGEFIENSVRCAILYNNGKFCGIEKTIFETNISNYSPCIINEGELSLNCPKIKDERKSILNKNYILLRKSSPRLENMIYGEGRVEKIGKIYTRKFDFGYLDEKIHDGDTRTIVLDEDITFQNYERDYYEGGIELDIDNLIIDGNGKTIDGGDKSRIFLITGKNILLKNITFKNGHSHKSYNNPSNNHGGAIKLNRNTSLTLENCEFISNRSEENGGTIFNLEGELKIIESTFAQNIAKDGGVIFNEGKLSLIGSSLLNNNADDDAGAVANLHRGEMVMTDCNLSGNASGQHGGAIVNIGNLIIKNTVLNANKSGGGGAIENNGDLNIFNSTLNDNVSNGAGAIDNMGGVLNISNSVLKRNSSNSGGAVYMFKGEVNICESELIENTVREHGGAIYVYHEHIRLNIEKSTFRQNTAEKLGGAICNFDAVLFINGSEFVNNISKENGGSIYNERGEFTIIESSFEENTAKKFGGAIHHYGRDSSIRNSMFTANTADDDGGAVYNSNSNLVITKSEFNENRSYDRGGAICILSGQVNIADSALNKNSARGKGGAIFSYGDDLNIINSVFIANSTDIGGGAFYNYKCHTVISDSAFNENTSRGNGGAIYLEQESEKYELDNCSFNGNEPDDVYE